MDDLDRIFRRLVQNMRSSYPQYLTSPFSTEELYQVIVPYRHNRQELGIDTNQDYEMALLRLLSGERGYLTVDRDVREALTREIESSNPDTSLFRAFNDRSVTVSADAIAMLDPVARASDDARMGAPTQPMRSQANPPARAAAPTRPTATSQAASPRAQWRDGNTAIALDVDHCSGGGHAASPGAPSPHATGEPAPGALCTASGTASSTADAPPRPSSRASRSEPATHAAGVRGTPHIGDRWTGQLRTTAGLHGIPWRHPELSELRHGFDAPLDHRNRPRRPLPLLQWDLARWTPAHLLPALRTGSHRAAMSGVQHGARAWLEVLHDLRSRCGAVVRWFAASLLSLAAACGGGDRQGLTADSAVMQPGAVRADAPGGALAAGGDSALVLIADDTTDMVGPAFVLIADSVTGDVLFRRKGKCLSCHGAGGKGIEGLGPNLRDSVWLHGDGSFAFIERTIVRGIGTPKVSALGMPSFGRVSGVDVTAISTTLSPEEIYHITAYVYTLSHPGSAVADTSRMTVPDTTATRDTLLQPPPPTGR